MGYLRMTNDDLNSLCWPAMRYALGRKNYVVDTVCRALINNASKIRSDIRHRMSQEISKAFNADEEKELDHFVWNRVLEAFSKVEE